MVPGLYTGASGMKAQMNRMDALSNNLANVDVTGYKRDLSVSKAFPQMLIRRTNDDGLYKFPFGSVDTAPVVGKIGTGVEYNETYTVFEQGSLQQTENPFDMALDGEGFFSLQTDRGERYSRNGSFHLSKEGILVNKEGYPVLGTEGPIEIKKNNFVVDSQGRVYQNSTFSGDPERLVSMEENEWENLELVDTLKVVNFDRPRFLQKEGSSMWKQSNETGDPRMADLGSAVKVEQGFLEGSNVNPVTEMVRMIEVNRAYEANQKAITTQDSLSARLINDVLKV
ncbi:MAG TPA: flagellar basal-body rod protein FlgF [Sediminispirochaeta sp.]|nr:flagellar basal-body rod protein FlgF [Sediminispirochaeta sp.]